MKGNTEEFKAETRIFTGGMPEPRLVTKEEMESYTLRNPEKLKEVQELMMTSAMSDATKVKPNKSATLTYLPWAAAWEECIKFYPQATYSIKKNTSDKLFGLPVFGNSYMGFMSFTEITIEGITREMWLPVMDNKNASMLKPTTFAVNKTVMRCLVKNLAMFGLGMYIFKGEDLPDMIADIDGKGGFIDNKPLIEEVVKPEEEIKLTKLQEDALSLISEAGILELQALKVAGIDKIEDLIEGEGNNKMVTALNNKIAKNKARDEKTIADKLAADIAKEKATLLEKKNVDTKVVENSEVKKVNLTEIQKEVYDLMEKAVGIDKEKALLVAGVTSIEEITVSDATTKLTNMLERYIAKKSK